MWNYDIILKKSKGDYMKIQKPTKFEIILVIWIITPIILTFVSSVFFHNTMTGADGLKNIILSILFRTIAGLMLTVPMIIIDINIIRKTSFKKSKFVFLGIIFSTVVISLIFFGTFTRSHLVEHHYIRKQYNIFADCSTLFQCVSDLANDDYETFTINNSYINKHKHLSSSGRGGSSYHYEYTATFYKGDHKITEMQTGADDIEDLKNLPYGFDTEITVYKKSGFLRSVKPSVNFSRNESYEHFFTISVNDDKMVYEKNADVKIDNLTWSGFKKKQDYDIHNSLFGINAENGNSLDTGYMNCDDICLYGVIDGQYRRLSNILTKEDY